MSFLFQPVGLLKPERITRRSRFHYTLKNRGTPAGFIFIVRDLRCDDVRQSACGAAER
jgi:hypothetical protein